MMDTMDAQRIAEICRENGVIMVGVFGSAARGQARKRSDIDLLVQFAGRKSLLALVKLERELATALGKKVDVLNEAAISPYLRERILHDLRVIYDAR